MKKTFKNLEREQLLKKVNSFSVPPEGWVRTMRKALGMTMAQLAKKMGVSQSRIHEIEIGEISNQVTLKTLRLTAEKLGCRLEYAFIPEKPIEDLLKGKAQQIAQEKVAYVSHQMALENQSLSAEEVEEQTAHLVSELLETPKKLWDL